ncbi:protein SCO1 homolog, mitochondrial-like [Xenia sp. Carnegie-2017]|uniref:protein SCO1 homolog, mitochondrial-like n=1 Tax=Xenia sp. Carnegie-2017 TaxID=2897299 RepID=UPI001F04D0BB|nr:protein SCO1 homolog, mitochondrial-like [Xenia sp. Carnegie-2017]
MVLFNMAVHFAKIFNMAGTRRFQRIRCFAIKIEQINKNHGFYLFHNTSKVQCRWLCDGFNKQSKKAGFVSKSSMSSPIRWTGFIVTVIIGGAAVYYVKKAKEEMGKKREVERNRSIGKAAIGGPFTLVNHEGITVTHKDFFGNWLMLYFGFTHCPDVCPETLEKLQNALDKIDCTKDVPDKVLPIFITVDPARDDVNTVAEYIKDFHPRLVGLTGTDEQIKAVCKEYRVYYSAGPADADNDYIVDHSVILYLVDPQGEFVDYFGQNMDENEIANTTISHMLKYKLQSKNNNR